MLADVGFSPVTTAIGSIVEGVDIRERLDERTVAVLREALGDRGVLFFRNQDVTAAELKAFVSQFGEPYVQQFSSKELREGDPVGSANVEPVKNSTAVWHADTTFATEPPMATALRAIQPAPVGGDTCWSSMYAAYDALSGPMRTMLDGLTAMHSMAAVVARMGEAGKRYAEDSIASNGFENPHPVVRVHPETGRKALFVNKGWTDRILGLTEAESDHILAMLFEHVKSPDFTMRWKWTANDLAFWDNRCVQHYAVPDYTAQRVIQRVVLKGDRPVGPKG